MKTKHGNKGSKENKQKGTPTPAPRGGTVFEALDLELLRSGDETVYTEPLHALEKRFRTLFPDIHEHASLSLYLLARLDDYGDSLPARDRMLTFFLLRVLNCNHTLVEELVRTLSLQEKLFLLRLLLFQDKDEELFKESLDQQLVHDNVQSKLEKLLKDTHTTQRLAVLEQQRQQHKLTDSLRGMRSIGVSPVLCAPFFKLENEQILLTHRTHEQTLQRFEPRFERPQPPLLPPKECHWINPHTLPHSDPRKMLMWCPLTIEENIVVPFVPPQSSILDTITQLRMQQAAEEGGRKRTRKMPTLDDEEEEEKDIEYYKELFSSAFSSQMKPAQETELISFMQRSPASLRGRLSPTKLVDLVHNNPHVATQSLLGERLNNDNTQWDEYMGVLVDVRPVTVNSMEVVNGLLLEHSMDPHHLHAFIRNCITSCDGVNGRTSQSRLVRMVCVFVQKLIHTRVLDVSENGVDNALLIDLRPFCIEFSRIKEATVLFKLLESSDKGG